MTPELWPLWCRAISGSLSSTASRASGWRRSSSRAVARPMSPAPTTAMSYSWAMAATIALRAAMGPETRYRWVVLAAGTAAQASYSAIALGVPVMLPALRSAYGLSLAQAGVVLAAPSIGSMLSLLPWGLAADRVGERIVVVARSRRGGFGARRSRLDLGLRRTGCASSPSPGSRARR